MRHGLVVFESVEVDDLIVAQRGIGPLSIRSRVNQPPGVSDGNFRDFILQIVPTRLAMRKCDFGVCMCELEQQPNETCKIGHRMKIEKVHM